MNTAVSVLTSTELESSWRHQVSHLWTPPGEMAPYGIALSSCLLQVCCRWSPVCSLVLGEEGVQKQSLVLGHCRAMGLSM